MTKESLRIVFMGTPEFAVESLRRLVEGGYNVVGVITMPDKAVGRHGSVLQPSPVKQYAVGRGLPVLQPERLKDEEFLASLRALRADLQVVVAFRMLPEAVWAMPPLGTINLHASLLPKYRGAAPINWALIYGERETGVTTFLLSHEIDTGAVLRREPIPVGGNEDAGTLHDRLMLLGARVLTETVDDLLEGRAHPVPQEQLPVKGLVRPAPKIFRETCRIDWWYPSWRVHDFVRGLSPYPAAWTELHQPGLPPVAMKIYKTEPVKASHEVAVGSLVTNGRDILRVAVPGGYVSLLSLQLAGKKRLSVEEFLRGFRITLGTRVE